MKRVILTEINRLNKVIANKRQDALIIIKDFQVQSKNTLLKDSLFEVKKEIHEIAVIQKELWFIYKEIAHKRKYSCL
ncbi:hypothetical protein ABER75_22685 [Niallia taxi]|uniref:Uncharacterized protein n=1 Tax=Niallia taxi TaxID=2499688 RepID=A0A3S2TW93_9BACI|nr:hypothetical protein [Niallia taxi]MCM3212996.1 hypothetical protein [Niallia taxi]MDK8641871.1 hypothetical protein [Niallia taxi]MED4036330.1 hypothetical protein [Niallia taxi]MED4054602.1 hypothetical protein [Niallia taxi]MED4121980.1 hypothetical protein [Niallia taxi]